MNGTTLGPTDIIEKFPDRPLIEVIILSKNIFHVTYTNTIV